MLLAGASACSTEAPPTPAPDLEARGTVASASAPTETTRESPDAAACRTAVGPRLARERTGDVYETVAEHTVPATTEAFGAGCLVVLYRNFTAPMLAPGDPWPYAYAFFLTDADGGRAAELELAVEPGQASLAGVGFGAFNGDGETDVVAVHDAGPALAWLSVGPERWAQDLPAPDVAGIDARTVAEAKAYYGERAAAPSSP